MELQNWAGAMHDNMLKALELAEAKESRMAEMDVRNAKTSQEAVDDFKEMTRRRRERQRTMSATRRDLGSRRGSKWSVTSTQEQVQTGTRG